LHEVIVGSNRNRILLALGALAALGALEVAVLCGTIGFIIEFVFGIDLPIINWIV
jgi:hypothetical protein